MLARIVWLPIVWWGSDCVNICWLYPSFWVLLLYWTSLPSDIAWFLLVKDCFVALSFCDCHTWCYYRYCRLFGGSNCIFSRCLFPLYLSLSSLAFLWYTYSSILHRHACDHQAVWREQLGGILISPGGNGWFSPCSQLFPFSLPPGFFSFVTTWRGEGSRRSR